MAALSFQRNTIFSKNLMFANSALFFPQDQDDEAKIKRIRILFRIQILIQKYRISSIKKGSVARNVTATQIKCEPRTGRTSKWQVRYQYLGTYGSLPWWIVKRNSYRLASESLRDPEPGVHTLLDISLQSLPKVLPWHNRRDTMRKDPRQRGNIGKL